MLSPEPGGMIPQRKLGTILVWEGMVTEDQLAEALEVQKADQRYVGKILVSLGYLSEEDLACALSKRLNVEYVDLSDAEVEPDILGIISEDVPFLLYKHQGRHRTLHLPLGSRRGTWRLAA